MYYIELSEDSRGIGGEDHLLEVVDDDLVSAVGAQRGLDGGGDCPAGFDVAQDSAIFSVIAAS